LLMLLLLLLFGIIEKLLIGESIILIKYYFIYINLIITISKLNNYKIIKN